jgi:hypothetical protein
LDTILGFFSDLILFSAGLVVALLWITLFILIGIEIWDAFHATDTTDEEEDF